jgi:hypothetical protein
MMPFTAAKLGTVQGSAIMVDAIVEAANQASLISNIGFTAAHQQLIYDVSSAFYANAAALARVSNAVQSLKNAVSVQVAAENRMKRGVGTAVEAAQARQADCKLKGELRHPRDPHCAAIVDGCQKAFPKALWFEFLKY